MLKYGLALLALLSGVCAKTAIYEYTCFGYSVVDEHEVITQIRCNSSDVFDPSVEKCVTPQIGHWPCADIVDCSKRADKRYVDIDNKDPSNKCKTYYTCHNGYFYGHNYCPGVLVFNEEKQYCDWIYDVKPPCGTLAAVVG
ncbi:uncharacterized protein [Haliotis cracherodii]|uniref:uncharacterized protein n=1 Tax=Haliotis cracherodii TaxID=6455 RepID=UPI0039E8C5DC